MAVTMLEGSPYSEGHRNASISDIDGLASYTTGGQAVAASSLGLSQVEYASAGGSNDGVHIVVVVPGAKGFRSTIKLMWIVVATGVEVAAAVNLSSKSVRVKARGL